MPVSCCLLLCAHCRCRRAGAVGVVAAVAANAVAVAVAVASAATIAGLGHRAATQGHRRGVNLHQ